MSGDFHCGRHAHNTNLGASKCRSKYADKRISRHLQTHRTIGAVGVIHDPPKEVMLGPIKVFIFSEALPARYERR